MKIYRKIKPDFKDSRGAIIRPLQDLLKEKIKSVSVISTEENMVRGNHYHKKEAHYMYIAKGTCEYYGLSATKSNQKPKRVVLREGDMVFSPIREIHAVKSLEPCIFIYLSTIHRTTPGDLGDIFKVIILT